MEQAPTTAEAIRRVGLAGRGGRCAWLLGLVVPFLSGCAMERLALGHDFVSHQVEQRTGYRMAPQERCASAVFPYGASLRDGLDEDEAIMIALWNNAAFNELLAEQRIAHSDLVQAGQLPNPEFGYFFSAPGKPYKYVLDLPIEVFFLRPVRLAAAGRENERVSDRIIQGALDLIRDVRQAFADVELAERRLQIAEEAVRLRSRLADLAEIRLNAGDISVQEAGVARADALLARQDRVRAAHDVPVAEERLRHLMAVGGERSTLRLLPAPLHLRDDLAADELTANAVECRPDALAAEQAVAAAAARDRLAHRSWLRYLGILDATSGQITGREFGPGFRVTVPIFNQNQGANERARAEVERARRQWRTVQNQIVLDVHQALQRYEQALAELTFFENKVQPEVDATMRRVERAFRDGDTSYTVVLETSRRFLDSRLRAEQLRADVKRAWAELERSVGRRLDVEPTGRRREVWLSRTEQGGRR